MGTEKIMKVVPNISHIRFQFTSRIMKNFNFKMWPYLYAYSNLDDCHCIYYSGVCALHYFSIIWCSSRIVVEYGYVPIEIADLVTLYKQTKEIMHTQTWTDKRDHWSVLIQEEEWIVSSYSFTVQCPEHACKTVYTP